MPSAQWVFGTTFIRGGSEVDQSVRLLRAPQKTRVAVVLCLDPTTLIRFKSHSRTSAGIYNENLSEGPQQLHGFGMASLDFHRESGIREGCVTSCLLLRHSLSLETRPP